MVVGEIGVAVNSVNPSCGILGEADHASRGVGVQIFTAGAVCLIWPSHRLIT